MSDAKDEEKEDVAGDTQYHVRCKIDDVLTEFGGIGKFQIILMALMSVLTYIVAWRILFDLFAAKTVDQWECTTDGAALGCKYEIGKMPCQIDTNGNLEMDYLNGSSGAGVYWKFDEKFKSHSIKSAMDLPCSENWKFSFTSSIYFVGAFFGVWMFGRCSDYLGRRPALLISLGMCMVQGWVIPFFNNINVYLACRFFDGAAFGGFFLIGFVITVEYAPPLYRNRIGTAFHFITSIGMAKAAIWGVLFKPWSTFAIALAVPATIMFPLCYFFIPESPRFYLSKGDDKKALELLKAVSKANGNEEPTDRKLYEDIDSKVNFITLFKNPKLIVCGLINMFGWFMTSLVYYMLWFSAKYLAGNIFINAAILGIAEIPGRIAAYLLMEKIGRRQTFMLTVGMACVCMFVSIWKNPINVKIMYCLGKALAGALWAVIYLYSSEMYPTRIRNLGSGIGSAAARVAALIAPFIGDWIDVSPYAPYIIVGVLAIICCGVFIFVPETSGKELPQTLEEFDLLFEEKKKPGKEEDLEQELTKI